MIPLRMKGCLAEKTIILLELLGKRRQYVLFVLSGTDSKALELVTNMNLICNII